MFKKQSKYQSNPKLSSRDQYSNLVKRFHELKDTKLKYDLQSRNLIRYSDEIEKIFSIKKITDVYHVENKLFKLPEIEKTNKKTEIISNKAFRRKSVLSKNSKSIDSVNEAKTNDLHEVHSEDFNKNFSRSFTDLNSFTYQDTSKAWVLLKEGYYDYEPEYAKITQVKYDFAIPESLTSLPDHKIPYINSYLIDNDLTCYFCKEMKLNEKNYPCRICNRVYHLKCIEQKGLLRSEQEKEIILQAFSNIGWSCYECSNLGNLIGQNEILELIEKFESSDVDNDHGISCEEFLRMRKDEFLKQYGVEMSQDDIDAATLRFQLIDNDKSGYIDWDEYLNYECMRRLHKIPARELVLKLTPKERQRARETFFTFDNDKGGTISEEEAKRAYRHWFIFLYQNLTYQSEVDTHVNAHTDLVMKASTKRHNELTWEEFIKEQAIYILVNRPNNPYGLITASKDSDGQALDKTNKKNLNKILYLDKLEQKENEKKTKNCLNNKKIKINKKMKFNFERKLKPLNVEKWILNYNKLK